MFLVRFLKGLNHRSVVMSTEGANRIRLGMWLASWCVAQVATCCGFGAGHVAANQFGIEPWELSRLSGTWWEADCQGTHEQSEHVRHPRGRCDVVEGLGWARRWAVYEPLQLSGKFGYAKGYGRAVLQSGSGFC